MVALICCIYFLPEKVLRECEDGLSDCTSEIVSLFLVLSLRGQVPFALMIETTIRAHVSLFYCEFSSGNSWQLAV